MKKIKEVIIVEGKHDIDFLKSFLDADFIKTDGTSLPKETKELKKKMSDRGVIVLTDPDSPGEKIRKEVNELVKNCKHAFIRAKNARYKHKVGVEHTTKEEVLEALENLISYQDYHENITSVDLLNLGLIGQENSSELRYKLQEKLHLGNGSAKTFLKRVNMLNIDYQRLEKEVKNINEECSNS